MRRHLSLDFWSRVRTVNWLLGGIGLMIALFCTVPHPPKPETLPGRTISRLLFSPDGRTLVGAGSWQEPGIHLGETRVWDVGSGKRLWSERHDSSGVLPTAFVPDGSSLVRVCTLYHGATASLPFGNGDEWDCLTLRFYDTRTGRTTAESTAVASKTPFKPVSIDVAPDGRTVAVAVEDGIAVWDLPVKSGLAGAPRWFPAFGGREWLPVSGALFTRDGGRLVVSRVGRSEPPSQLSGKSVEVWDSRTGAVLRSFNVAFNVAVREKPGGYWIAPRSLLAALSQDRQRLATVSQNEAAARFALWDVETGKLLRESTARGEFARGRLDRLEFMSKRRSGTDDVITVRVSTEGTGNRSGTSIFGRRYWLPGSNRIKENPPQYAFVLEGNEAVSPNEQCIARPGGSGDSRSVWLYESGGWKAFAGME